MPRERAERRNRSNGPDRADAIDFERADRANRANRLHGARLADHAAMKEEPAFGQQRRELPADFAKPPIDEANQPLDVATEGSGLLMAGERAGDEPGPLGIAAERADALLSLFAEAELVEGPLAAALGRDEPLRAERGPLRGGEAERGERSLGFGILEHGAGAPRGKRIHAKSLRSGARIIHAFTPARRASEGRRNGYPRVPRLRVLMLRYFVRGDAVIPAKAGIQCVRRPRGSGCPPPPSLGAGSSRA
ncbi:MAG: hypothetical protein WD069_06980 [Planctomycetales bacterium]